MPPCPALPRIAPQLSALVLSKLLSSLPHMRKHLRAGYLLGDTRHDGTAGGLAMNNKVRSEGRQMRPWVVGRCGCHAIKRAQHQLTTSWVCLGSSYCTQCTFVFVMCLVR
jgi:hypothetical protein